MPSMETIYCNAQRMFAWLGVEDEVTRGGIESIDLVAGEISRLFCYPLTFDIEDGTMSHNPKHDEIGPEDLQLEWNNI